MKGNKGITLIALVITIIVLLILAGVSIAMLSGDNSILKRGQESSVQTAVVNARDDIALKVSECITEYNAVKYAGATSTLYNGNQDIDAFIFAEINKLTFYCGGLFEEGIIWSLSSFGINISSISISDEESLEKSSEKL